MGTFLFVHGAGHGGWCWHKVAARLQEAGHTAITPDLPGHGIDRTPFAQVSLDAYTQRICQILSEQREPAILIGHSLGGMTISEVAEQMPASVRAAVYVTAFLLQDGQTPYTLGNNEGQAVQPPRGMVVDEQQGVVSLQLAEVDNLFYHDCSPADIALAQSLLTAQPLAPMGTPVRLSEHYHRVKRVYIECLQDRAISIDVQRYMQRALPCDRIFTLDTSHSPFFSAPEALANCLEEINLFF